MHSSSQGSSVHLKNLIFLGICFVTFFIGAPHMFAATTATLLPVGEGTYLQMTPSTGVTHYTTVDESTCNGVTDYVSELTVGERDSFAVSIASVPDGSTVTQVQITPCASRNTSGGGGSAVLNVFYRYNGVDSADAGAYSLPSAITPALLAATNFSSLSLVKTATSTLEIGTVYTSGNRGVRVSRMATVVTYTPPAPQVVTQAVSSVSTSTATLNGSVNPNGVSSVGWFRYATTSPGVCTNTFGIRAPITGGVALGSGTTSVNYVRGVTGLTTNTTYYVCAIASSTSGTTVGSVQSFTTNPLSPSAPTSVSAVNISGTQNDLTWVDTSAVESGFAIERSVNGGAYSQIATTTANVVSYSDTGATADTTYIYRVRAFNVSGNSGYAFSSYVITATVVPNAPTSFTATASTSSPASVLFTWSHTGNNEDGFGVEKSIDNVNFSPVTTVGRNVTSATEFGVTSATYYYRVYAYNVIGASNYSNTVTTIVP